MEYKEKEKRRAKPTKQSCSRVIKGNVYLFYLLLFDTILCNLQNAVEYGTSDTWCLNVQ